MLISILVNYITGRLISLRIKNHYCFSPKFFLITGILANIGLLISFKYSNFIVNNINIILPYINIPPITLKAIHLPLGISFFTFQAISYIVDVYRNEVKVQKNIYNLALYISLFPQLIAGPIVRYHDVAQQIVARSHSIELFSSGVQRFIIGLSKKMLIANPLGEVADTVFSLSGNDLTMPLAWIGIVAYSLQIYFDFSGYSDMAIGLGRMFGFRFHENFNHPYMSSSLREFWKRWHISLSSWFRDYVYIPLGGSRVATYRIYINLIIVFFLTGIWHGASWNFVIWGMFHGFFLTCEHMGFSKILSKFWKPVQHLYIILIILLSWVLFRADSLTQAINYIFSMFNVTNMYTSDLQYAQILSNSTLVTFILGILFCFPVYHYLKYYLTEISGDNVLKNISLIYFPKMVFISALLAFSILKISASTYNPFIYFRF